MAKTVKTFLVLVVLFLLSPVFWQIPEILKKENLDTNPVWQVSEFETADINQIRGWHRSPFEESIAKIAWNRPITAGEKLLKNIFILLDPNLYFFGEHPRERLEPQAREKLLAVNLPLLLWGLWLMQKQDKKQLKKWSSIFTGLVLLLAALGITNNLVGLILSITLLYPVSVAALKLIQERSTWTYIYAVLSMFGIIHWFINYA